ncbi:Multidrug resistance-associated protein 4, partial [Quaeritorhiza haematococci]
SDSENENNDNDNDDEEKGDPTDSNKPQGRNPTSTTSSPQNELSKEEVAKGTVSWSVYLSFFNAGGGPFISLVLLTALILGQTIYVMNDWWLARWASLPESIQTGIPTTPLNTSSTTTNSGGVVGGKEYIGREYASVYAGLTLGTLVLSIGRAILFFMVCLNASRKLFERMLGRVVRAPMWFFQVNPHGRLMNRFSKDLAITDEMLPLTFFDFAQCAFAIVGTFAIAVIAIPYVLISVPPLLFFFYHLRRYYVTASRQIKRLESTTRSPVYSTVSSTLEGLSTIRAFHAQPRFTSRFIHIQNENTRAFFAFLSSGRWLGFRLDLMVAFFVILVAFLSVGVTSGSGAIQPGLVGLVLSYSLQLLGLLQWAVRQSAEVENQMVSVERVIEYTQLPQEAAEETDVKPPREWPEKGHIKIEGMSLTYPGTKRRVLKDLRVEIEPGMRVGIVGRTGAGKSSFLQALFRLVEPTPPNSITIDSIPTSSLGLTTLRSRISIIPQEPFCFKGTLRFNIDPFNAHTDEELWRVLEAVELKGKVEKCAEKMEVGVEEGGGNWSVGERQLICLARAILRDTKLIVMDEATSAVDLHTDALVQRAIRSTSSTDGAGGGLFANATVLTIAHRLNTVIDFDRILVLDAGRVVEYGTPWELLQKDVGEEGAWFRRMVEEMGEDAREVLRGIAWEREVERRKRGGVEKEGE